MRVRALRLTGSLLVALAIGHIPLPAQAVDPIDRADPPVSTATRAAHADGPSLEVAERDVGVAPSVRAVRPAVVAAARGLPVPAVALSGPAPDWAAPCEQSRGPARRAQQRKRSSRLFGWLYRSVRNVDMEKGSTPPLLFYLRSPLLAGFGDDMDCPPDQRPDATGVDACATIKVHAEKHAPQIAHVLLPVLDATNAVDLDEALRFRLEAGEAIILSTLDGKGLLLSPDRVRDLDVRPCALSDPGSDEDEDPSFAY